MVTTTPPPEPPTDTRSLSELQGPYLDLIDRCVRRRVPDPRQAERIVREVFQKARANPPPQVQANPLQWLIAAARRACAQVRRANPIKS
jgi:DNA-directed RNA polymerase specialized sigma24 family protein